MPSLPRSACVEVVDHGQDEVIPRDLGVAARKVQSRGGDPRGGRRWVSRWILLDTVTGEQAVA